MVGGDPLGFGVGRLTRGRWGDRDSSFLIIPNGFAGMDPAREVEVVELRDWGLGLPIHLYALIVHKDDVLNHGNSERESVLP